MAIHQLADQMSRARTVYTKAAAATLAVAECQFTKVVVTAAGGTITLPAAASVEGGDLEVYAANDTSAVVKLTGNTAADLTHTVGPRELSRIKNHGAYWYTTGSAANA